MFKYNCFNNKIPCDSNLAYDICTTFCVALINKVLFVNKFSRNLRLDYNFINLREWKIITTGLKSFALVDYERSVVGVNVNVTSQPYDRATSVVVAFPTPPLLCFIRCAHLKKVQSVGGTIPIATTEKIILLMSVNKLFPRLLAHASSKHKNTQTKVSMKFK